MELQNKESRPSITYKLINTIRNKTLNCKDIVNFTAITAISFNLNTDPCECEHSPFIDPHHKQIIAGDLTKGYTIENLDQLISINLLLKYNLLIQLNCKPGQQN